MRDLGEGQSSEVQEYQDDRDDSTYNLLFDKADGRSREDEEGGHQ